MLQTSLGFSQLSNGCVYGGHDVFYVLLLPVLLYLVFFAAVLATGQVASGYSLFNQATTFLGPMSHVSILLL